MDAVVSITTNDDERPVRNKATNTHAQTHTHTHTHTSPDKTINCCGTHTHTPQQKRFRFVSNCAWLQDPAVEDEVVLALLTADASGCKALAAQVRTDEHSPDKTIICVELPSSLSVRQAGGRAG